jgi:glyoxylase-like metal-dependent hydrolase (beta-lactamase superfamily II)
MLKPVTDGILIHQSKFLQSNATVVQGRDGVLLIDPGITTDELVCLAADLAKLGQPVVAGFSTHPHWDHLLWHPRLGNAVRYGTDVCVADIQAVLSSPDWKDKVARVLPPDIADEIPMDGLGRITGLPKGAATIPWDGPEVQIIEHQAHAAGHAALLVKDLGVLIAGDMLSDRNRSNPQMAARAAPKKAAPGLAVAAHPGHHDQANTKSDDRARQQA